MRPAAGSPSGDREHAADAHGTSAAASPTTQAAATDRSITVTVVRRPADPVRRQRLVHLLAVVLDKPQQETAPNPAAARR